MNISKVDKINVMGMSVRTNNVDEMNPSTAKIGALWETFYAELAPKLTQDSRVFGLYTNYESDHTGAFDVVACSDSIEAQDLEIFQIDTGDYLVFSGTGAMPQAVIDLWRKVWNYFDSEHCEHRRTFTTDFEWYKSENEIEIYISVEEGI